MLFLCGMKEQGFGDFVGCEPCAFKGGRFSLYLLFDFCSFVQVSYLTALQSSSEPYLITPYQTLHTCKGFNQANTERVFTRSQSTV